MEADNDSKHRKPTDDTTSDRPIYLLDMLRKPYEAMIRNMVLREVKIKEGLLENQFGLCKGTFNKWAMKVIVNKARTNSKWLTIANIDVKMYSIRHVGMEIQRIKGNILRYLTSGHKNIYIREKYRSEKRSI